MSRTIDADFILQIAHSPLSNYAGVPGLTSYLIGALSEKGCARVFHSLREHEEAITPHSHRFDFECFVLRGEVRNHIWTEGCGDLFSSTRMKYLGTPGDFEKTEIGFGPFKKTTSIYSEGEAYRMKHDEIHSINFSRGAVVLFIEGPQRTNESIILQPHVNGETVPTFEVRDWMYKSAEKVTGGAA